MAMRQLKIVQSITNRDSQGFERYLQEIGKIDLISPEEEVRLARRIKLGDEHAIQALTKANLRFVVSVAKQYQFQGLSLSDLINEGNVGLIKAAGRFDETKGFKFISYAVWWIRQTIISAISEQASVVRLPFNKLALSSRIQKASNIMEQQLERLPSAEELAEELDVNVEEVRLVNNFNGHHKSLDSPISESSEESMADLLPGDPAQGTDSNMIHVLSLKLEIGRCLQTLPQRQRDIVTLYYGIGGIVPMSLTEIGNRLNITQERVRQLRDKAIMQLRRPDRSLLLQNFLGT